MANYCTVTNSHKNHARTGIFDGMAEEDIHKFSVRGQRSLAVMVASGRLHDTGPSGRLDQMEKQARTGIFDGAAEEDIHKFPRGLGCVCKRTLA